MNGLVDVMFEGYKRDLIVDLVALERAKMSTSWKEIWFLAQEWREEFWMLWLRFSLARAVAVDDISMPVICRLEILGWEGVDLVDFGRGWRREWRRSAMHPVPVHRSRMRSDRSLFGKFVDASAERIWRMIEAALVTYVSVSGRGISTPFLQRISRLPKGCVPRMYCSGSPLARRLT